MVRIGEHGNGARLTFMIPDPANRSYRAVQAIVPLRITRTWSLAWSMMGAQVIPETEMYATGTGTGETIEALWRNLGGTAFANPGSLLIAMIETQYELDRFRHEMNRPGMPGHAELLIAEAKALAYESPFDFLHALGIIRTREMELRGSRIMQQFAGAMHEIGRTMADAFTEGIRDAAQMAAAIGKDAEWYSDPDWADERRSARLGAITGPLRPASDPAYHRWQAWRHRNGVDRRRRMPDIRARGFARHR